MHRKSLLPHAFTTAVILPAKHTLEPLKQARELDISTGVAEYSFTILCDSRIRSFLDNA